MNNVSSVLDTGMDHDAETLRAVSDSGNGLFYYVGEINKLHEIFGKCLGGLISTVATNISLTISSPVPIRLIENPLNSSTQIEDRIIHLKIPNLYEGEVKNFVFNVSMRTLPRNLNYFIAGANIQSLDLQPSVYTKFISEHLS